MTNDLSKKKGKTAGDKKGKRKVKRRETYAMYIYKVLKQVRVLAYYPSILSAAGKITGVPSPRFIRIRGFRAEP